MGQGGTALYGLQDATSIVGGCFNQHLWDFNAGKSLTDEVMLKIKHELQKRSCDALSILGRRASL